MKILKLAETKKIKETMNHLGKEKEPFLFLIDYEMLNPVILPLKYVRPELIQYEIKFGLKRYSNRQSQAQSIKTDWFFYKTPTDFNDYFNAYQKIYSHFINGDTYLVNLTFETPVSCNLSLLELFELAEAPFKICYQDQFTVFSPEAFVVIEDQKIASFPMKGTIDAQTRNAENVLLNDEKELAEHVTIVDLIRNDLSQVAHNVRVESFRFLTRVKTRNQELIQASSKIVGDLDSDYTEKLGDIIVALLPAGSICGAPKKITLEIIRSAETYQRGYYSGVFGVFDGQNLYSAVMIRFIEKKGDCYVYKSGGGLTYDSVAELEYQEMVDKIYVPIA